MTTGITSILKNILKFITFIGAVVAAVFLLRAFVIEPFVVPTGSMESTIEVPRRSATPNFSAGDSGIDCYMIHPRGTPVQSQTSRKGPMGTRLLRVISFAR